MKDHIGNGLKILLGFVLGVLILWGAIGAAVAIALAWDELLGL